MKNKSMISLTLIVLLSFSTTQLSAYSNKTPYSAKATKGKQQTIQSKQSNKIRSKTKKPEYYRPGHSDGLQNYPGKTIDAGANTGMLPTNSSSPLMGNDITF
jgi:hypothetical protein